jgi:5-methylcytosine-specific restriction enzyme A
MSWRASNRRQHLPPGWSHQTVPRILARDRGICHRCGQPGATEVDHINRGDDHRDVNLGAIHHACHQHKTMLEAQAARRAQLAVLRHPGETHPGAR